MQICAASRRLTETEAQRERLVMNLRVFEDAEGFVGEEAVRRLLPLLQSAKMILTNQTVPFLLNNGIV